MTNPFYTRSFDVLPATRAISQQLEDEFLLLQNAMDGVQSSIEAAQGYAGAPAFSATAVYTSGFVVYSTVDGQLYRRNSAGTSATDPISDATNWTQVVIGLVRVEVSATTQIAIPGRDYWLENVAATAVTAPTVADGAHFAVTPANGLKTNTIDFGAATVRGPNGTATGIITIDLGARMEFIYSSTLSQWVML